MDVVKIDTKRMSDIQAGDLFAGEYAGRVKYVKEKKSWALYDGKRWMLNSDLEVMEYTKEFVMRTLPRLAANEEDGDARSNIFKWIAKLQSNKAREDMLKAARSKPGVLETMSSFDADYRYINLNNGVFDLTEMKLLPHNPDMMLSKMTNVNYNAKAAFPRWNDFILQIMNGREDLAEFLQKSLGYALLGNPKEECMFILYGAKTRNGKGTLCHAVVDIFGEYGTTAATETIAVNRNKSGSAASPDLAALNSVRFVNMSEPREGMELNEALVKQLTGRDPITARHLNEGVFTFTPKFSIFMNANALPVINDMTMFSSDRVICIPFDVHFKESERDKNLGSMFATPEAKSAIFNWMVEGLRMYKEDGLKINMPQVVVETISEYEKDSDAFGSFIDECILQTEFCKDRIAYSADVYRAYKSWAESRSYKLLSIKSMVRKMKQRGFTPYRSSKAAGFKGIVVLGEDENSRIIRYAKENEGVTVKAMASEFRVAERVVTTAISVLYGKGYDNVPIS